MGCLEIKEKLLRCEKCFMLKLFLIKPDYPQTTLICKCSCGMFSIPLLSFTKALQAPLPFKITCAFCGKEPKHPLYCPGCRKIYCNTCKYNHNTEMKSKVKHNLIDAYKYDFYCAEHQDLFNNAYCDDCKLDICNKCIKEKLHVGHIVYMYSQLQLSKNDEKKTKNDIEASAEKIIKKINMSKVLIKQLSNKEQIENLKEVVNTTMMDNKSIIALIQFFYQMYIRAKHKNYALIHNIKENMKFNLFPFQLVQSTNLDERLNDFLEYLKSDFVLFKRIISTKKKQKAKDKKEKNNNENSENQEKINIMNNISHTITADNNLMNINENNENKEIESNININNELEEKKDMNENESDDLINEEIIEIKEEELNVDKQQYINNNRNNSEDVAFRKRAISIFDINKIIKEKYDDAIFKEDSEEINTEIKPDLHKSQKLTNKEINKIDEPFEEMKNNNEDKELIMDSNNSKEENSQIVSNEDKNQNLLNNFEKISNIEEVKEINLNENSNEIKENSNIEEKEEKEEKKDNDMNIIIEQDKEKEQDKEQENPLIKEKILNEENKNESKEEVEEKENNNQNNIKENIQNDNNIINIENEKNNIKINNKHDEKVNVDKVNNIEEKNNESIKNNEEIKKEEIKLEDKKEEKKEEKKVENKIEEKKVENKIEEVKKEEKKEVKKEEKKEVKKEEKKEVKKEEKKEVKKDEKKEVKKEVKKEEKKELKKEEKKEIKNEEKKEVKKDDKNIVKKEPQKSDNKFPPRKVSGLQARMNIFEKKPNNNSNTAKPDFKKQLAKKTITAGILNNPKFSNLAKMMNTKMPHGPAPKKENLPEKPNILSERVDPNTILMNAPMVSKNNVKKKPKRIVFE